MTKFTVGQTVAHFSNPASRATVEQIIPQRECGELGRGNWLNGAFASDEIIVVNWPNGAVTTTRAANFNAVAEGK